jgi:hypothetical protein
VDLVAGEPFQPVRSSASANAWARMSGRFESVRRVAYQGKVSAFQESRQAAASAV